MEAIHWYIYERAGKNDFAVMAAEFPLTMWEAFVHSGTMVFDKHLVKQFEPFCREPKFVGEVYADADEGEEALSNLRFRGRTGRAYSPFGLCQRSLTITRLLTATLP